MASNYPAGTFQMLVDAGYGTFVQTFPIGAGGCQLFAPGPITCFVDGGGSFTQVTFTQTGPTTCVPAGCGVDAPACSAPPGAVSNWALSATTPSSFTLSSVDPNPIVSCTGDGLLNPMVFTWTLE